MSTEERQQYLEKLQQILPPAPAFDAWLKKTGALPPDFNSLPRINSLPDPLTFLDGRHVATAAQWAARRQEISELSQRYEWGKIPPKPKIDRAVVLDEKHEAGYTVRNLRLEFGAGSKGTLRVRVYIPDARGPFPAMINTSLAGWAPSLVRRGFISAGYAGKRRNGRPPAPLDALYPDYDFALLPRRAWCAGLVIDYLATLKQMDMKHIGIFGYSARWQDGSDGGCAGYAHYGGDCGQHGCGRRVAVACGGERGRGRGNRDDDASVPDVVCAAATIFCRA